ncbi:hypothetical protein LSAT2_024583 [Lamellibrachia satsuma]|nr:hypothetical protein LSAT2_024583 [Lamellibrachia satsuma]
MASSNPADVVKLQRCGACDGRGCERCWRCRGCGQIRCRHCGGDGVIIIRPGAGDNVLQDKCLVCRGDGQKRCSTCEGEGAITCKSCDGYGRLKCFIQLTVTFVTHVDDYVVEETAMPDELIQNVGEMTVFEQNLPQIWPIATYSNAEINENSQRLVDLHKRAFPNERQLRQRHHLSAVPVTEVHYEWHDGKGRYYVFGQERKVHAPDYPQQCCWGCTVI